MKNSSKATLEKPNRVLGLLAAVLVGWALMLPTPFLLSIAEYIWRPTWNQTSPFPVPALESIAIWVWLAGLFGLPIALVFCFSLGYPAWRLASWFGLKRRRDAIIVGTLLGATLGLPLAVLAYLGGLPAPQNPALTKLVVFYPGIALYLAAVGAAAGLAAWRMAGRKSADRDETLTQVFA